jgi:hypothetical protein
MSPHQQERDTKMAMLSFGGIDVSKDRLDVMVLPEERCAPVNNDATGWAELVEQLRGSSILDRSERDRGERIDRRHGANLQVAHRDWFVLSRVAAARGQLAADAVRRRPDGSRPYFRPSGSGPPSLIPAASVG